MTADASADAEGLLERIHEAGQAGIDLIQIREPALSGAALFRFSRRAVAAAAPARVVINDRADVALASGAAGVHLRGDSMAASRLRASAPAGFLVGRSVHDAAEAVAVARDGGVDYLIFGPVFSTRSKPPGHTPAGLDALRGVTAAVDVSVIAIGGITPERIRDVMAAGAAGIAAIGMFSGTNDLASLMRRVRRVD